MIINSSIEFSIIFNQTKLKGKFYTVTRSVAPLVLEIDYVNRLDGMVDLPNKRFTLLKGRICVPDSLKHYVPANISVINSFDNSSIQQQ